MKKTIPLFLVISLLFNCIISMNEINALESQSDYSPDEQKTLITDFQNLGLSEKTAEQLTIRYLNGEMLDCMKDDYDDKAKISVIDIKQFKQTIYDYPDGSRKIVSISGGVTKYISGGNYTSGGNWYTWNSANVFGSNGIITVSYKVNISGSLYDGHLISMYSPTYSPDTIQTAFSIISSNATVSSPAFGYFQGRRSKTLVKLQINVPIGNNPSVEFQINTIS